MFQALVLIIMTYFVAAIPFGYLAGKLLKGIDIREHGSKSTGATNVYRCVGKIPGLMVLVLDVLKSYVPVTVAIWLGEHNYLSGGALPSFVWQWHLLPAIISMVAVIAHSRSIFLDFKGGKSAATALGTLFALGWQVGVGTFAVFFLVLGLFRIVSLSSIAAAVASVVFQYIFHGPIAYQIYTFCGATYVIVRHIANIKRLLNGTEPRLGNKIESPTSSLPPSSAGNEHP